MERLERTQFQNQVLIAAKEAGFAYGEVFYLGGEQFEILLLEGEVSKYENSREAGISFRGNINGRTGYAYTERLTMESIPFLLQAAKENALLMPAGEMEEIYGGEENYAPFDGYSPALEQVEVEKRIALAKRMETAALHGADRVASLDYCVLRMTKKEVAIQNSMGLDVSYVKNLASGHVTAIAKDGQETKTGSADWKGREWSDFDPDQVGRKAAERAASLLGAKAVPSGAYPVLFHGEAMTQLLQVFRGIFFGETVQKGFSLLQNKIGERIAAPCITLRDDALLPHGYASVPFDSEGVAGQNKEVIGSGVLQTLLYNRKTAKKDGVSSTGNGFRFGLASPIQTACTNFYIAQGDKSRDEIMAEMGEGLFITGLMGMHAGTNVVSGDFSLLAEGFLVKNGKVSHPVEQITVAGNFYRLLLDAQGVAKDLYFNGGGCGAPSVWIKELNIGGE